MRPAGSVQNKLFPARTRGLGPGWFFIGFGTLITFALVSWFVLPTIQKNLERPALESTPDYAALIPINDPLPNTAQIVQLAGIPLPSYVVGYNAVDGTPSLAFAVWNRGYHRYDWVSRLALPSSAAARPGLSAHQGAQLDRIDSVQLEQLGPNQSIFMVMGGPKDATTIGSRTLVTRDGESLRLVLLNYPESAAVPAIFPFDGLIEVDNGPTIFFSDVNADGINELIEAEFKKDDQTNQISKILHVYRWQQGNFYYDDQLSQIIKLKDGLFPEPATSPE